ncbi:RNA polymerase sigma factor [Kineosporia sp. NBRC 101677]|uniref:RNA polymerase sigma factor n=1 Tax=Kineosporia sp. NBRC 101677 TaxID=3032197 RepID=UPI0024A2F579|nr:sigma-70 family RNA polymerase sigma factor [Kineosporia sp. NBRC 101677]GLY14585.1 RNA polymerase sigma factor [Kineosporia sp. NBRC 101677]
MEHLLRELAPQVLAALVRRGHPFAAAEDALQEALLEAWTSWPEAGTPASPRGWLVTVASRRLIDSTRSEVSRRRREEQLEAVPGPGPTEQSDDTLLLLFLCCHSSLSPSSAVALTLRAVGGLTTRQIAEAFLVPEATMAQRISRAKKMLEGARFGARGDLGLVLRVLYLIFNEGYTGSLDLGAEAIRLTRRLVAETRSAPEPLGLLALMLLHDARRPARFAADGSLVPLDRQDRSLWNTARIEEGVRLLQAALAQDQLGEYQAQAAVAALHDDAATAAETDWPQILSWYDELLAIHDTPAAALSRAVAVGEADGPQAGLRALEAVRPRLPAGHHRFHAVRGHLLERSGDTTGAAAAYAQAARLATNTAERDHLSRQAGRMRA